MPSENHIIDIALQSEEPVISMSLDNSSAAANEIINDNAGAGVTDKTWSADKLTSMFGAIGNVTLISENKYRISL